MNDATYREFQLRMVRARNVEGVDALIDEARELPKSARSRDFIEQARNFRNRMEAEAVAEELGIESPYGAPEEG